MKFIKKPKEQRPEREGGPSRFQEKLAPLKALWLQEWGQLRQRAGHVWGRLRGKQVIRPARHQLRDIARRRFRYEERSVILFALCPAVALSGTLAAGLLAGVVILLTMVFGAALISLFRLLLPRGVGRLCHVVILAALVSGFSLVGQALFPQLVEDLGIYLPLVAASCVVLEQTLTDSHQNGSLYLLADACACALSFTLLLAALSIPRELLGQGTLLGFPVLGGLRPLTILSQPFGAFLMLGLAAALLQWLHSLGERRREA